MCQPRLPRTPSSRSWSGRSWARPTASSARIRDWPRTDAELLAKDAVLLLEGTRRPRPGGASPSPRTRGARIGAARPTFSTPQTDGVVSASWWRVSCCTWRSVQPVDRQPVHVRAQRRQRERRRARLLRRLRIPVYSTNAGMPGTVLVRASSLDDPERFVPGRVVYASRAPSWAALDSKLASFSEMPPAPEQPAKLQ